MQVPVDPHKIVEVPKKVVEAPRPVVDKIVEKRESAFKRFPLLFTLLATFGVVAVLYGFEHLIDNIGFLANNPIILLATGIVTLAITGTLYNKL